MFKLSLKQFKIYRYLLFYEYTCIENSIQVMKARKIEVYVYLS